MIKRKILLFLTGGVVCSFIMPLVFLFRDGWEGINAFFGTALLSFILTGILNLAGLIYAIIRIKKAGTFILLYLVFLILPSLILFFITGGFYPSEHY